MKACAWTSRRSSLAANRAVAEAGPGRQPDQHMQQPEQQLQLEVQLEVPVCSRWTAALTLPIHITMCPRCVPQNLLTTRSLHNRRRRWMMLSARPGRSGQEATMAQEQRRCRCVVGQLAAAGSLVCLLAGRVLCDNDAVVVCAVTQWLPAVVDRECSCVGGELAALGVRSSCANDC